MSYIQCCPQDQQPGIGFAMGLSAIVEIPGDVYDQFICVLPLDETSGDTFYDRTRLEANATGTNTMPDDGVYCLGSQHLNGGTSFITMQEDPIRQDESFSCSIWARNESNYLEKELFSRGSFRFGISFLGKLTASLDMLATNNQIVTYVVSGDSTLVDNQFSHCAAVWNKDDGTVNLYLNGVLDGSIDVVEYTTAPSTESYLGQVGIGERWQGNLQEFRLTANVLSAEWFLAEYDNVCGSLYSVGSPFSSIFG